MDVKAEIRERYDRFANSALRGGHQTVTNARSYFWSRKLEAALALGAFPPSARLLEIGCNVGQFTFRLADRGFRVSATDLSAGAIAVARSRAAEASFADLDFSVGDAETLEQFPDNHFDGVVSFSTLRYVPALDGALAAIKRVLKPGCQVVADFPNRLCPWFYVKPWLGSERHPHDHWFTAKGLQRRFAQAGYLDLRVKTLLFTPTVAPDSLLRMFQLMDMVGERTPGLKNVAGIIMIAARKP